MSTLSQEMLFILRVRDEASAALRAAGLDMRGLARGAAEAQIQARGLAAATSAATTMVRGLAGAFGALSAAATIRQSLVLTNEYNKALVQSQTLAGANAEQVKKWGAELKGLSLTTGKDPRELATALQYVASSGIDVSRTMEVMDAASKGAIVGLGDTKDVANAVTSALNAYRTSNITAAEATGTMIAAVREGKMEAREFSISVGRVLGVSSALGVEFKEVSAGAAFLSQTGSSAGEAITALRQIMYKVVAPTTQARKTLKDLNLDMKYFQDIFRDKGFLAGVTALREKLDDVNLRKVIDDAEGFGAIQIIMQNLGKATETFGKVAVASAKDLRDAFKIAADSGVLSLDQGMQLLRLTMIEFGTAVMPVIIAGIRSMIEAWNYFMAPTQEAANRLAILKAVLGGVTTAFVALWLVMNRGAIFSATTAVIGAMSAGLTFMQSQLLLVATGFGISSAAAHAFKLAMISTGVGALIVGLGTLAAVAIYTADSTRYTTSATQELAGVTGVADTALKNYADAAMIAAQATGEDRKAAIANAEAKRIEANMAYQHTGILLGEARAHLAVVAARNNEVMSKGLNAEAPAAQAAAMGAREAKAQARVKVLQEAQKKEKEEYDRIAKLVADLSKPITMPPMPNLEGGDTGGADRKSAKESVDKLKQVLDQLRQQALAYRQSAEAQEYLTSAEQAGIDTSQAALGNYEKQLEAAKAALAAKTALTDSQKVALAVETKYTSEIEAQTRAVGLDIEANKALGQLALSDARTRAIQTAAINAQTDAKKRYLSATQTETAIENAKKKAASAFDTGVTTSVLEEGRAYETATRYMQQYIAAADLDARSRAMRIAYLDAERAALDQDSSAEGKRLAAIRATNAARAAGQRFDQDYLTKLREGQKAQQDNITVLEQLGRIRSTDAREIAAQTAYIRTYNEVLGQTKDKALAAAEGLKAAQLARGEFTADTSNLATWDALMAQLTAQAADTTALTIFRDGWTQAFDSVGQAAKQFFMGQEVGWGEMVANLAASVAAMIVQALAMQAVLYAMEAISPGSSQLIVGGAQFSNAANKAGSSPRTGYRNGGSFDGGITAFAKGSAFANSVVNQATPFAFNKGGRTKQGVMGEAGPEAVMPLVRTKDGKLGVMSIQAQQNAQTLQVVANIDVSALTSAITAMTQAAKQWQMPEPDSYLTAQSLAGRPMAGGATESIGYGATQGRGLAGSTGGDTYQVSIDMPVTIPFQSSGNEEVDQRTMKKLVSAIGDMVDKRVNEALIRAKMNGGVNNRPFNGA